MKIAILHPNLDVKSGAERQVLQLAVGLKEKGHEITIYVSKLDPDNCFPELIRKVKIVECGGYGYKDMKKMILLSPYFMRKMAQRVLKDIQAGQNYDLIHCHNYPSTYTAVKIKKGLRKSYNRKLSSEKLDKKNQEKNVPIVWMCNEPPFPPIYYGQKAAKTIKSWVYRLAIAPFLIYNRLAAKEIDQIMVLDQMNFARVKLTYRREPTIVHTGLDLPANSNISSDDQEKNHNNPEQDHQHFVILATGRIDQGKRTEDAILALSQLKGKIPNILLKIAGGGQKLEEMKQLAEKLGLNNYIRFYGRVSDQKLQELYSSCDVFLFTAENQSWGLVPLEAMSYGKPCLVSTGAGVSDVLTEKENCLKINPRDVNSIVQNILLLRHNSKLAEQISKNGEKFVKETFSWEKYVDNMEEIFVSLKPR